MRNFSSEQSLRKPLSEIANLELIGINETVDQNKMGASKTLNIASTAVTGEIVGVTLISSEDGSGAILRNAADLVFFRSDPTISANDDALLIADANASTGYIPILAGDWLAASSGTDTAGLAFVPVAFPFKTDTSGNLYVAVVNRGSTSFNSAAGDDEQLEATLLIRLDD